MNIDKKTEDQMKENAASQKISRRGFISAMGAVAAGSVLNSCKKKSSTEPENPENPNENPNNPNKTGDVALAKLNDYNYATLKSTLETMFTQIGGLDLPGAKRVAIKINLTGGLWAGTNMIQNFGCRAEDSVWTNDQVLRAVAELLIDAGANIRYVVEGQSSEIINSLNFSYGMVLAGLGIPYLNLNNPDPFAGFAELPVENGYNFDKFTVNPILTPEEIDVYVTIPKMKIHLSAGITLSMKNNVGMVPDTSYGSTGYRNHLHGTNGNSSETSWHLPRTIVDLNMARPVNLTIIDGITTMDKGEGHWVGGVIAPVSAKALVVSKDALKADSIGMQVMGFDPLADHYDDPFIASENFLLKAQEKGLGDPDPDKIVVSGKLPSDFTYQFHPSDINKAIASATYHPLAPYGSMHPNDPHRRV